VSAPKCTSNNFKDMKFSVHLSAPVKWMTDMAILKTMPEKNVHGDRTLNRVFPVTVKLTKEELGRVTDFAKSQGLARGEWIRDVILRESGEGLISDPALVEILGVRLLLVNVLRPLASGQLVAAESFDKLLDEISAAKHQLAAKLAAPAGRK
jgi:hypothetical protein